MSLLTHHRLRRSLGIVAGILIHLVIAADLRAAEARVYLNRFWQTSEGMPSNAASDVAKDRDGFLWIGTGAGVARFDGIRFEVFTSADGLPDTRILSLHIDASNRVWVGTRHGVAYRENGTWHVPAGLPDEPVFSLGEAADGSIWVGTFHGCWRWANGKFTSIQLGKVVQDTRAFLSDGENGMWILTQGNLSHWKPDQPAAAEEHPGPWLGKDLRDLARDRDGRLIICGTGILLRRQENGWEDLNPLIPGGTQNANLACAVAPDNTLWLATRNRGLIYLKGRETGFVDSTNGLALDDARSVMIDDDGMIWAGTNGGGINCLRRRMFDTFSTFEGLGHTVTSALAVQRDGTVLAGTDGGGIFSKVDGKFEPAFRLPGLPDSGLIWSLCAPPDGSLWVGTYGDGLFRIQNDKVVRIPVSSDNPNHSISALHATRDGGMLIGVNSEGVMKWKDGKPDPTLFGPPASASAPYMVYDMLEDQLGRIWVATGSYGLWVLEPDGWREISRGLGMPDLLPTILHQAANGDVWIGTLGQGLVRWRNNQLTNWRLKDGLVSDTICQILEDGSGHIWLGSDRGLQRVSSAALEAYHTGSPGTPLESERYNREDGLPTPQFSAEHGNLAVRASDGSLWFSLASGAIRVDPTQVSKSKPLPVVRIESAAVDKGPIWSFEGLLTSDTIILKPGAGTLQIRFTSPGFIAPERARFRFRMAGLENEWQEVEGTRVASYASLLPRSYHFEVMAAAADGTWNPLPTRVRVVVEPFIWQTLGFRIFVSLLILTATGVLIRTWSLRRIRRRLAIVEQERRMDKERARIARDLHDELGATLTEINYLGTLAADSVTDHSVRSRVEGMVDRAQRMAKSLDEIVWTVNPANDSLSSTANYLCSRTEESLATADIRCRLDVADDLPAITVDSELRHHLLMAVNEAIHNVMKHSGASECTLSIHSDHGMLWVLVADNGCGFRPADTAGDRNGLINLQRRMEASGGSVNISSSDQGTTVNLRIPLP